MHVFTLNCHSWVEENSLEKLQQLVDTIVKEKFDVLLLQEVNQRIGSEPAILDEWYCFNNDPWPILADNFALVLSQALQIKDEPYYWTWGFSHIGYGKYEEGLAILSKEPLLAKVSLMSTCDDIQEGTRRILLSGVTESAGNLYTIGNVHHSWWEGGAFETEWARAEELLSDTRYPIILGGDFNQIAGTIGHQRVLDSPLALQDSFLVAEKRRGEATIEGPIDGWQDYQGSLRIDYLFVSDGLSVTQHDVMFDGHTEPVVSDHFGVRIRLTE